MSALVILATLALQPDEVLEAERTAREFLRILGVPTQAVRVRYGPIAPHEYGETEAAVRAEPYRKAQAIQRDRTIWYDEDAAKGARRAKNMFHEFWHYYQQQRVGYAGYFSWAYTRLGYATPEKYDKNRFEREAYIVQEKLYAVHKWRLANPEGDLDAKLKETLRDVLPEMRRLWRRSPVAPWHLDRLDAAVRERIDWRQDVRSAGQFAAAYLVKESIEAIELRDPARIGAALREMATPGFAASVAVFGLAARGAERYATAVRAPGLVRAALPLVAGMAAVQLLSGRFSARDVAVSTAAFLATGLAVSVAADALIYPALFAAGPPGWVAAGSYSIGKMALTLYFGEKLADWLSGLFDRDPARGGAERGGLRERVEAMTP